MKILVTSFIIFILLIQVTFQLQNLLNTPTHKCIECLCHARTGCYNRTTCASYSINYTYWTRAGSPTLNVNDSENLASFNACMRNENCILNTIKLYTDGFNSPQCDCDDVYDCRDMLMLHLNGENCQKNISNTYMSRYNRCASRNSLSPINTDSRCRPAPQ